MKGIPTGFLLSTGNLRAPASFPRELMGQHKYGMLTRGSIFSRIVDMSILASAPERSSHPQSIMSPGLPKGGTLPPQVLEKMCRSGKLIVVVVFSSSKNHFGFFSYV